MSNDFGKNGGGQPTFRSTSEVLLPPKPKEFVESRKTGAGVAAFARMRGAILVYRGLTQHYGFAGGAAALRAARKRSSRLFHATDEGSPIGRIGAGAGVAGDAGRCPGTTDAPGFATPFV